MARRKVLFLGPPIRIGHHSAKPTAAARRRRMATDRRAHEPEVLDLERSDSFGSSGSDVPSALLSRHGLPVSQSVLQLALSDWNNLRVPVESREAVFWPQCPATAIDRLAAART